MVVNTLEQKQLLEKRAGVAASIGAAGWIIANLIGTGHGLLVGLFVFCVFLIGMLFWVGGCMLYSIAKGYNKWLGLIGLTGCIGFLAIVFIPDRNKHLPSLHR